MRHRVAFPSDSRRTSPNLLQPSAPHSSSARAASASTSFRPASEATTSSNSWSTIRSRDHWSRMCSRASPRGKNSSSSRDKEDLGSPGVRAIRRQEHEPSGNPAAPARGQVRRFDLGGARMRQVHTDQRVGGNPADALEFRASGVYSLAPRLVEKPFAERRAQGGTPRSHRLDKANHHRPVRCDRVGEGFRNTLSSFSVAPPSATITAAQTTRRRSSVSGDGSSAGARRWVRPPHQAPVGHAVRNVGHRVQHPPRHAQELSRRRVVHPRRSLHGPPPAERAYRRSLVERRQPRQVVPGVLGQGVRSRVRHRVLPLGERTQQQQGARHSPARAAPATRTSLPSSVHSVAFPLLSSSAPRARSTASPAPVAMPSRRSHVLSVSLPWSRATPTPPRRTHSTSGTSGRPGPSTR